VSSREIVALLTAAGLRRRRQSRLARPWPRPDQPAPPEVSGWCGAQT